MKVFSVFDGSATAIARGIVSIVTTITRLIVGPLVGTILAVGRIIVDIKNVLKVYLSVLRSRKSSKGKK